MTAPPGPGVTGGARPLVDLARRLKPLGRRAVDKVVQPYVDQVVDRVARVAVSSDAALPAHFTVLQETLHEARTLALADVPKGAGRVLSAGASGTWYFRWIEDVYGPVAHHIGVEAYSPRPDGLPANVEWIAADLAAPGGIHTIGTHGVDLVFSGQNVEHLWPEQMVTFFEEASRVLRPDGLLVIDSPNRALTAAYRWSMAEHTVELTPSEAADVLSAAGFAVERMKGVWLCRDHGELLPLEADPLSTGSAGIVRRFALAAARPDESFIWWAEARRVADPQPRLLRSLVHDLFAANWDERVSRLRILGGRPAPWRDGSDGVVVAKGDAVVATEGPSMPLPAGEYAASIEVAWRSCDPGATPARLEVVIDGRVVGSVDMSPGGAPEGTATLRCPFSLDARCVGVSARLVTTGFAEVAAPLALALAPAPWMGR